MKLVNLDASKRLDAILACSRAEVARIVCLRAGESGASQITPQMRDEMLAKATAGEYVELFLDLDAYEQEPGERNRKFIRVRDGAMAAFGRSAKGRPFLRDHEQTNTLARGGTIVDSKSEKLASGGYVVHQTVKLTAPWAVDLALRGLLDSLSVGIHPGEGGVTCTVCGTQVFESCYHMRGEEVELESGEKVIVEWEFEQPEIVETSTVPVPAVVQAQIKAIRASLSAVGPELGFRATSAQEEDMKIITALTAILSLPSTAGEDDITKAVEVLKREAAADKAELSIAKAELGVANAELNTIRAAKNKADEDKLFADTIARGAMVLGGEDEKAMREFYAVAPDRAAARLAARPDHSATPVGAPRQAAKEPPVDPKNPAGNDVDAAILAAGGDPVKVRAQLASDGLSPDRIEKQLAAMVSSGKGK